MQNKNVQLNSKLNISALVVIDISNRFISCKQQYFSHRGKRKHIYVVQDNFRNIQDSYSFFQMNSETCQVPTVPNISTVPLLKL